MLANLLQQFLLQFLEAFSAALEDQGALLFGEAVFLVVEADEVCVEIQLHRRGGRLRWQNPESLNEYLGAWQPVSVERNPLEERFFVGLRLTQGIRPEPREWEDFGERKRC